MLWFDMEKTITISPTASMVSHDKKRFNTDTSIGDYTLILIIYAHKNQD
jgi:hypothetical protein